MDKFLIRRASEKDASLISVLGATTFYEAYSEQDDPAVLADYICESFSQDQIRSELADPNSVFFIASMNGRGIGYARLVKDSRIDCIQAAKPIELKRIYIVERFWGKGYGKTLLNRCIDEAKQAGCDALWLTVWWQNKRGIKFYERLGFKRVGTLDFMFGTFEETNDVMRLDL